MICCIVLICVVIVWLCVSVRWSWSRCGKFCVNVMSNGVDVCSWLVWFCVRRLLMLDVFCVLFVFVLRLLGWCLIRCGWICGVVSCVCWWMVM